MNILIFSNDPRLVAFCRDIATEVFGPESKVEVATAGQAAAPEDLCLWDFIPGETSIPEDFASTPRHLFLLRRQDLPVLQELLGTDDINVLLKPVMPATLRAFLGDANRLQARDHGSSIRDMQALRLERDEMLQFLIQANLRLQEYDQERTNFLARSVHDFRAPLTAIGGYCSLLLEDELGPLTPDQREVLGRMQNSAKRLSRITDAMFHLSIRQRVDHELNLQGADLRECVDQALHEVALQLEDKRISLTVEIAPPPAGLLFDEAKIEQTLVNLLDNARKFTPRHGTIELRGYPYFWERRSSHAAAIDPSTDRRSAQVGSANSFRVDIRDSGPGIPSLHAGKIFEEYSSYSGGQDRSGGGLGLAICRMILQQHGGRVWAESHASGAMFCFVLPIQPRNTHVPTQFESLNRKWLAGVEEGWI